MRCCQGRGNHRFQVKIKSKRVSRIIFSCLSSSLTSRFLYPLEMPLREKIATICREIYGADGVDFSETAERRIEVSMVR